MGIDGDALQKKLMQTFAIEAVEHVSAISKGLIELEKSDSPQKNKEWIETIFREAHSLKGAASAVECSSIEGVCHEMESIFSSLKSGESSLTPRLFDELHQKVDFLNRAVAGLGKSSPAAKTEGAPALESTVRITTSKLDTILVQIEEMLSSKLAVKKIVSDLKSVRGELETGRDPKSIHAALQSLVKYAEQEEHALSGKIESILSDVKKSLLLPFSDLINGFPKLVRDLSREEGKEAGWEAIGTDIEIDRRILEELKDPLIHLLRNSLSHGIELPQERSKKGKPREGKLTLEILQKEANKVEIRFSDDGAGISIEKVAAAAVKSGALSPEAAATLSPDEAANLIFQSGISTSPLLTDLSGRGLGLAIVREKVENLGGAVFVESVPGVGTSFRIVVPSSLSTFRGILVGVAEQLFILPTIQVDRVLRLAPEELKSVENREAIQFSGETLALVRLDRLLGLNGGTSAERDAKRLPVLILSNHSGRIGFAVDKIFEEQDVLVKSMGKAAYQIPFVSGFTILSSGKVVPILNASDLVHAVGKETADGPAPKPRKTSEAKQVKSILVVEDSITSRTLIKNILEGSGYRVQTAVDGVDAFTKLRTDRFNLVVSDVDMPRMNGFNLTEKIREDKKLAELPVVLVTALESKEDRERGIDAGANAYLVKSSFNQSNLLEAIGRLI